MAWIEGNRRKVDEAEQEAGVHLFAGYGERRVHLLQPVFLFAGGQEDGAVVDERFNGGGTNTDYILDYFAADADDITGRRVMGKI